MSKPMGQFQVHSRFSLSLLCSPADSTAARFTAPQNFNQSFYRELKPISNDFQPEALRVNGLDRDRLVKEGESPEKAMTDAAHWIRQVAGEAKPILVAYPLSFDWSWLYWYFTKFSAIGSPFNHSLCLISRRPSL